LTELPGQNGGAKVLALSGKLKPAADLRKASC
jgi:hypothetical protein